jgi:hypothetical protein
MFGGIYKCSRLHRKDGRIGNREGMGMNILIMLGLFVTRKILWSILRIYRIIFWPKKFGFGGL